MVRLGNDWDGLIGDEFSKEYYLQLREFLKREYNTRRIYPDMYDIFNALKYTPYGSVRAVIIGQDPYHGAGQAHGLCFSVKKGVTPPPSLVNIFKELHDDLGLPVPSCGELTPWARQGVLLLNTVLTVREGQPASHKNMGWETFTDAVISKLNDKTKPVVFLLWGAHARRKAEIIDNPIHYKLCCAHPSPLSAYNGFFGCRHFSAANELLVNSGQQPIDWHLE
ncbi:MAG: uracil-DNA glycosylase [Firmicutes bacterium]|nr:uracil-DNA glycosylase [Bacillota bacterium]